MKNKIIRQFAAAVAALLIVYGVGVNTFRSYEQVMAAQAEIPPAIVVKNNAAAGESESVTTAVTSDTASTAATTSEAASSTAESTTETESVTMAAAAPVETPAIVEATPAVTEPVVTEPEPDVPSLSEFMSQLRCGGCGKNCSLLNPRCGVGNQKAQQAEAEYYATYS
ncbi:hypothetical protein [Acetobacterium sp.]|uniref:hypothetical protein n=1 Tax=Acetobacterium sp. TaxID=1872094 RepID=UPI0035947126